MNSVIDPVCGMTIDPAHAAGSSTVGERTIYFCATHCKTTFDANPSKYLGEAEEAACCAPSASAASCCSTR